MYIAIRDQIYKWSFIHTHPILQLYNVVSGHAIKLLSYTRYIWQFGELVSDVNWWIFSLATRSHKKIMNSYEYRQSVHLLRWMKTTLPNCQIKITVKCTALTVFVVHYSLMIEKFPTKCQELKVNYKLLNNFMHCMTLLFIKLVT